jgi:hypothetical protein
VGPVRRAARVAGSKRSTSAHTGPTPFRPLQRSHQDCFLLFPKESSRLVSSHRHALWHVSRRDRPFLVPSRLVSCPLVRRKPPDRAHVRFSANLNRPPITEHEPRSTSFADDLQAPGKTRSNHSRTPTNSPSARDKLKFESVIFESKIVALTHRAQRKEQGGQERPHAEKPRPATDTNIIRQEWQRHHNRNT